MALAASLSAQAALPTVALNYTQPTGVAGPSEIIEVWVRLTVQANSSPLVFNASSGSTFGLSAADLPVQGQNNDGVLSDFASYNFVQTNTFFGCSGTFTAVCDPGAYAFNFHTASEPGKPSFNFLPTLNLAPGESFNYLFGTFTPTGGSVADGTYTFYRTGATLLFTGLNASGENIYHYDDLGEACADGVAACAFTRTVVGVPEPQTYALLMAGLLGVGWVARRRLG